MSSRSSSPPRCSTFRLFTPSSGRKQDRHLDQANFVKGDHPIYMISFFLLIVFFAYFYVAITFNPNEVADNMKKYGGFIPGIRAGKPTEDYLGLRAVPADVPRLAVPGV